MEQDNQDQQQQLVPQGIGINNAGLQGGWPNVGAAGGVHHPHHQQGVAPGVAFQQNIQVDMANPADIAGLANNVAALAAVVNTLSVSVHDFGRNVEQDRVATAAALRGMDANVAEVRQAQRQAQEALAADVRGTNDNITRATNGLADAIAQAQARVDAQQPQQPAAAHPGPAAHRDAQFADALRDIAALLAEQQGTRAQKIACTHAHFKTLCEKLGVLAVRAKGADIDLVHNALGVVRLVFRAAYPNEVAAAEPQIAALADAETQWHCEEILTVQRTLCTLKAVECDSEIERMALRDAAAPFFKKSKYTDSWFSKKKPPAAAGKEKQWEKEWRKRNQPQAQPLLQPQPQQQFVPQPYVARQPGAAPRPRPKGKNAGVGTDGEG